MKYIQKPLEVDARQLTEVNGANMEAWVSDVPGWNAKFWPYNKQDRIVLATTLLIFIPSGYDERRRLEVRVGDWLVRMGDTFYLYTDEEFNERFEKAE